MPVDIGKKQSIEEITNGRIKKVSGKEEIATRGGRKETRPEAVRKSGRMRG